MNRLSWRGVALCAVLFASASSVSVIQEEARVVIGKGGIMRSEHGHPEALMQSSVKGSNDPIVSKCNSMTCPTPGYYLRVNASDITCLKPNTAECTNPKDLTNCCKQLTKVETNGKCSGSEALNWVEGLTLDQCVEWVNNNGFAFFLHGGSSGKRCRWQNMYGHAKHDCIGEACCDCGTDAAGNKKCTWEAAAYDFYKLI